jgi:nitrite reductase (NADH) large subunit
VHRGGAAPPVCPICGAPASEFEPHVEPSPAEASHPATRYRCTVCNYLHDGPEPPERCPLCGAGRAQFEPAAEPPPGPAADTTARVLIVGGGAAGVAAAEALRETSAGSTVTILSGEPNLPYYRLNLTRYLAGEVSRDDLPLHPASWYAERRIELRRGVTVARLDLAGRNAELADGERLPFDRLILTAGAHPFVPPIPGADRQGVLSLRTLEDAERTLEAATSGRPCVCIGGGLLGLETAGALARRGADITVVESHGYLMPSQLDPRAGRLLAGHLAAIGVKLCAAARTRELVGGRRVSGVALEGGATLPARQADLRVNKGVVVDDRLAASAPEVFAAGDCAEHRGVLYGNWFVAQYQGNIAGRNAAGAAIDFGGVPRCHTLKVLGLDVFSIGQFLPLDGSYRTVAEEGDGTYASFVFRDSRLVGAILVGSSALASRLKQAIEAGTDFSALLAGAPTAADVAERLAAQG